MSNTGEIKILNKLLADLTQYSSIKLYQNALDEIQDSYGSRDEVYKVIGLDKDAIKNWERAIENAYVILTGVQVDIKPKEYKETAKVKIQVPKMDKEPGKISTEEFDAFFADMVDLPVYKEEMQTEIDPFKDEFNRTFGKYN